MGGYSKLLSCPLWQGSLSFQCFSQGGRCVAALGHGLLVFDVSLLPFPRGRLGCICKQLLWCAGPSAATPSSLPARQYSDSAREALKYVQTGFFSPLCSPWQVENRGGGELVWLGALQMSVALKTQGGVLPNLVIGERRC